MIRFQELSTHPLEDVVPSHGEAPGRVDEADRVSVETTGDGEQDGHFTKGVDHVDHHLNFCQALALRSRIWAQYSRYQ